jgi:hypothetical protein
VEPSKVQRNRHGVSVERSGWREQELSQRHRNFWGYNCPMVDLDFLVIEYNIGIPVALIEYKHARAKTPKLDDANYRAISWLADKAGLPFAIAFYWPGIWAFRITPVNEIARRHWKPSENMTEREFVMRLYMLRHLAVEREVLNGLQQQKPPDSDDVPDLFKLVDRAQSLFRQATEQPPVWESLTPPPTEPDEKAA